MNQQNPTLKDNLSKLKDAEQKLRENPTVQENLSKLKEAEQKFRDNPSVQENLSKLKGAEKKWRKDAKSKQVQALCDTCLTDTLDWSPITIVAPACDLVFRNWERYTDGNAQRRKNT